jgi:NADH-quinone oxidoreductase subunit L
VFVYVYLCLFVCFMNWFILSWDFLTAFIGWEFLGLFSFFLISYYWYRYVCLKFGFKAFLLGKCGDLFFLFSFCLCFSNFMCYLCFYFICFFVLDFSFLLLCFFCLLFCALSKSTQFGLHIWLPDAMEGPIPVSALIHAATLVVCGIILVGICYLLFRMFN